MGFKTTSTRFTQTKSAQSSDLVAFNNAATGNASISGTSLTTNSVITTVTYTPGQNASSGTVTTSGGGGGPTISLIQYLDANNNVITGDIAVSTLGGNVYINGTGFTPNANVYVNNTLVSNTYISSTKYLAQLPSGSVGNVNVMLFNTTGTGAILYNGIYYQVAPVWTTAAVTSQNGASANIALVATAGSAITYSLVSGSLPTGMSLNSAGYIAGTPTGYSIPTLVTFVLLATDVQGQQAQQTINYTVSVNDTYFPYVELLLNAENPTGNSSIINNNYIQDTSNAPVVITRTGNPTPNSFGPYGNNWSILFNGTTDYLTFPSNTALSGIANANMTLEFWVYLPNSFTSSSLNAIQKGKTGTSDYEWGVYLTGTTNSAGGMVISWQPNSGTGSTINTYNSSGLTINTSTWYHVAISISGTTAYFFLNGASAGSATVSLSAFTSTALLSIANNNAGTNAFQACYISNLRILKGTSLYGPSSFTPSTTPLTAVANTVLLTAQSNRFVDNSTTASKLTLVGTPSIQKYEPFNYSNNYTTTIDGGSIYFNGTTDYVGNTTPTANIINWYSANTTIEYWVYPVVLSSGVNTDSPVLGNMGPATGTNDYWSFGPISTGAVKFYYYTGTVQSLATTATITANQWSHLAFVNSSNTMTIYINGVANATGSIVGTPQSGNTYPLTLGSIGTTYFNGYVSDIRITKGVAYASNFTPTTTPLTPIANTILMINGTSGAIVDKARQRVITTIGNAKSNTTTFKFGNASMQFSGTGDYLISEANNVPSFGSGPFTVEGWVYFNTVTGAQYILDTRTTGTSATGMAFSSNATGYPVVTINNTALITGSSPFTPNTWIHFAVVKTTSNVVTTYLNGSNVGGVTSTVSITDPYLTIGTSISNRDTTSTNHLNGYLDDVRVSRYPRYVANFTPSVATNPEL